MPEQPLETPSLSLRAPQKLASNHLATPKQPIRTPSNQIAMPEQPPRNTHAEHRLVTNHSNCLVTT